MFEAMPWSLALSVELVDLKLPMAFSEACSMIGCATARDRRTRTCVDRAACTRQSCSLGAPMNVVIIDERVCANL